MAILVAASSAGLSLPVSSLPLGAHSIAESAFGNGRSPQDGKKCRSRLAGFGSEFLGESLLDSLHLQVESYGANSVPVQMWACSDKRSGRVGNVGKVSSTPSRRRSDWSRRYGGSGTFPCPDIRWVTGQAQKERLRDIIEKEVRARLRNNPRYEGEKNESDGSSNFSSLLLELERTLREEESVKGSEEAQNEHSSDEAQGPKTSSELTIVELMKELGKRLREERENNKRQDEERTSESPRFRRTSRAGNVTSRAGNVTSMAVNVTSRAGNVTSRAGNVTSWYDAMKDSDRGLQDERIRLEEVWIQLGSQLGSYRRGAKDETQESRRRERGVSPEAGIGQEKTNQELHDRKVASAPDSSQYPQSDGTVVYLKNETNGAEVYLVGTSHISEKSADQVREVIQRVKPDFVMVELCQKRYEGMVRNSDMDRGVMSFVDRMLRFLVNGKEGVGAGLARFYEILFRGFHPGKELLVAVEEGTNLGAQIVLGDQDIDTTQKQLGEINLNVPFRGFHKYFGEGNIMVDVRDIMNKQGFTISEAMQDRKVVRRFNEEVKKGAPSIYKVLVTDRNHVMIKALRNLKGKVVAVVGLAHMDGMEQLWHQANENDIADQSTRSEE